MLHSRTRWVAKAADQDAVNRLTQELNITPLVATLLVHRGIDTRDEARSFLFVKEQEFHDPYLLPGMQIAVNRISEAIKNQENIMIFGDYDADGVSSTAVMLLTLKKLGARVNYYIPNRFTEGYGPNEQAFRKAAESGVNLLITVDTGISAVHEAKIAKELGMDYIITDHHEPGPVLPEALAIIHPKLEEGNYPCKELAGVGVAFKVAHALLGKMPSDLLEIAAIGTIADLVPLKGENRMIAALGIEGLQRTNRPGLTALMKVAGIQQEVLNEESIGFGMAPRINAAGRLGSADPAIELLLAETREDAEQIASEIDAMNKERQALVAEMAREAIREVEEKYPPEDNGVLIVGKEGWNSGVVGIVASKLVERFYRPAIVLSFDIEKGLAKGSARSIEGFDLFKNLSTCRDILPHFGGHTMAAGMTLKIEDVSELRSRLNTLACKLLSEEDYIPVTNVDGQAALSDISLKTIEEMGMLAPFGMGNPKPRILIESTGISSIRKIGSDQSHMKLLLEGDGHSLDGIGFGLGRYADEISPLSEVSVVGELAVNEWNNMRKPQIFLYDLAVSHWQLFDYRGMKQARKMLTAIPESKRKMVAFNPATLSTLGLEELDACLVADETGAAETDLAGSYVVLLDMPPSRTILEKLLTGKHPERIYACFHHQQEHFFSTMPTRDHFKWYYAFLAKKGPFILERYCEDIAKYRGWSKDTIDFMSQVFLELEFVTIENGLISLAKQTSKRDLNESISYKRKKEQFELEQELLYSSYKQLFQRFDILIREAADAEEETILWT
ncbi:single-stranded-DNA-specific exonuclease RecJ [Peribacillus saganii]|uniref:Single-stranded-DNA-specific exonuclease RecJ n=1 Tax=Peribacillus saganii TaxID=2303992 RepID=A0A372LTT0_9BACI|nr:single-stranded-DNA-specific exonuclease RecJ [Peribacillus saganii]RFU71611.1 single-stranded-DNA-specific exonuclease RecJ [Peribacillus saganii]